MARRILVLDCNRVGKGPPDPFQTGVGTMANPKWRVVWSVAQTLEADLVWLSGDTQVEPHGGYDTLVFNRTLPGIGANALWLRANPSARVVHVTNDYLVGGGTLYLAAMAARTPVDVIANYPRVLAPSKGACVRDWTEVNLNALLYEPERHRPDDAPAGEGCVYYGAARPERGEMFRKYLTGHVDVAQYPGVQKEFAALGVAGPFAPRVNWVTDGLYPWKGSLYLWNTQANGHYQYPTNRFYEALSYDVYPVVPSEFTHIFDRTAYALPKALTVAHPDEIPAACAYTDPWIMGEWRHGAALERQSVLDHIRRTIRGN